jgi:peroxiredoxin
MAIQVGDKIPDVNLRMLGPEGPKEITSAELFGGKKVAFFAVPGAFTPTCSQRHLPGYVDKSAALKAKGVDTIACVSVNDAFVMGAWGKDQSCGDKVMMLADGNAIRCWSTMGWSRRSMSRRRASSRSPTPRPC